MASLGQALAGVAHEVSQPVAALTTHLASAKLIAAQRQDTTMTTMLVTMGRVQATRGALHCSDGHITAPRGPGLGVQIDTAFAAAS